MSEIRPIDKAIEILSRTNDGNDLSPTHLTLMEHAANGFLNEKGLEKLEEIYQHVMAGEYKKPYLQGVEFMTNDNDGFVYFKDKQVEHFSWDYMYSPAAKDYLIELQDKYLFMERNGLTGKSVYDEDFCAMYNSENLDKLSKSAEGNTIMFSNIRSNGGSSISFFLPGRVDEDDVWDCEHQKYLVQQYDYVREFKSAIELFKFGSGEERPATDEELKLINCSFRFLKDNNHIESVASMEFERYANFVDEDEEGVEL